MAPLEQIDSVDAVIEALGGLPEVQRLTEARSQQAVSNWKSRGRFSASTFLVMTQALRERGFTAPARLWGIAEPVGTN